MREEREIRAGGQRGGGTVSSRSNAGSPARFTRQGSHSPEREYDRSTHCACHDAAQRALGESQASPCSAKRGERARSARRYAPLSCRSHARGSSPATQSATTATRSTTQARITPHLCLSEAPFERYGPHRPGRKRSRLGAHLPVAASPRACTRSPHPTPANLVCIS